MFFDSCLLVYNLCMQHDSNSTSISIPGVDFGNFFSDVQHHFVIWWPTIVVWLKGTVGLLAGLCIPLSIFFVIAIVYSVERLKVLRKKEELIYDTKVEEAFETLPEGGDIVLAHRWENVVKHIDSPNENDWKQAILEADIILDELLTKMGYRGESVGEKLKRVESGDFKTVQDAWEAHKVRNQIAHTPGFTLNKIEAQQTYQLYKKVLDEFYYI